jgi:hypothetical protein
MQCFTALIPAHPHIQKRVQEELDRVVGCDCLPTIEDEVNLPYCRAMAHHLAHAFNITQVAGKPIDLYEYDGLSGRSPVAFEVTLRPRSKGTGKFLDREMRKWDARAARRAPMARASH